MSVLIRCRCGHEAEGWQFCPPGRTEIVKVDGKKVLRHVDGGRPNQWRCPKCEVTWFVTKDGIRLGQLASESKEQMRERIRRSWGLDQPKADPEAAMMSALAQADEANAALMG